VYNLPAPPQTEVDAAAAALNAALRQQSFSGTGIAFLDEFLLPYMDNIWKVIDTIALPFKWARERASEAVDFIGGILREAIGW